MIEKRQAFCVIQAVLVLVGFLSSQSMSRAPFAADQASDRAVGIVRDLAADIRRSRDQASSPSDRRQLLSGTIEAKTDVDLLSRLVLGRHWRSLGCGDRDEYRALFSRAVIRGLGGPSRHPFR